MNYVEKKLKINIDIPNAKTIENLSKELDSIEKKINKLKSKSPSPENTALIATLTASRDVLKEQVVEATKLADIFDRIGKGKKVSAADTRAAAKSLNDQIKAAREANTYRDRINKFAESATSKQQRAALQSQLLSAGYSMAEANEYSAKGMGPDDVKAANAKTFSATLSGIKGAYRILSKGANEIAGAFKTVSGISLGIKDNFNEMLSNVGAALNTTSGMASYNTGSSLFVNRNARNLQLRYGLNASQAYGFQQASSLLGFDTSDLSDYTYMNDKQRQVFNAYMEKSSAWYDKLTSSGVLTSVQELQLEFSLLKQELSMQFLSFIAENKDTIMALLQGVFDVASAILNIMPGHSTTTNLIGASASLGSNSTSKTYNIKVESTNSATGVVSDQTALMAQFEQWGSDLASQIATATGG